MPCALAARQNAAAGLHESARGVVLGRVLLVGVVMELQAELRLGEEDSPLYPAGSGFVDIVFKNVANAEPVHIIGAGPAGMFAALACIANSI